MRSLEQMLAAVVADSRRRTYALFGHDEAAFGQGMAWPLAHDGTADSVCSLPRNGVPATLSVAGCPWRGGGGGGGGRTHEPCCVPPPQPPPPAGGGDAPSPPGKRV